MPVKIKYARKTGTGLLRHRLVRYAVVAVLGLFILFAIVFGYYWIKYRSIINERLAGGGIFASISQIYAAPREIRDGQTYTAAAIAGELRRAGYNTNPKLGTYQLSGNRIFIKPGPESYHATDGATIDTTGGTVQSIKAENGAALISYELEPQLITALSENRTKRQLVSYAEIPPGLVGAVTSIEDHRFFSHHGIDYHSLLGWIWHDLRGDRRYAGGASTITMQLARGIFLTPERRVKRKLIEALIATQLESRFSKQQIFEMYVNQINLGHRGSYDINGVAEASHAFFAKDLKQLDTAQFALLAGLIQAPSKLNPYRFPERAIARRNIVLDAMVETRAITAAEAERAKAEPLHLAPPNVDASEAPYFVDLVHDQLVQRMGDQDVAHQDLRIYTSLDPDLQRIAAEAVDAGMKNVDELVRKRYKKNATNITYPQVALIALNPHTGQVLALVGGRNYGVSQVNHAVAKRPTGSIFKPFVYATAYNSSLDGTALSSGSVFSALTKLSDEPTTFTYDNGRRTYKPNNFASDFRGDVSAVFALAHSLNNATVELGQMVGFDKVAALAQSAGVVNARGTPSVAIGAYDAAPLDMAGAYTVFANNGVHLTPWMLASVRNPNGDIIADFSPEAKQVLDPRVAFLTQSMMEAVLNYGTAAGAVRGAGFTAPAAGKTGTSHDAWFAGYTSNLICIVWVGNDDYTDIKIEGAHAAAPIWTAFMKRAIELPQYSDVKAFSAPDGVTVVRVDRATDLLADDACPNNAMPVAFLDGTAPVNSCGRMSENPQNFLKRVLGVGERPSEQHEPPPLLPGASTAEGTAAGASTYHTEAHPETAEPSAHAGPPPSQQKPAKKKNFFKKLFGGGGDKKPQRSSP
ncbi:MAG: transglycosylase domain-containing protein [Acidobacteriaceae bacterium]|nr:transglycosylase domain-containing protein [Acidobacteriaceae bacterium]